MKSKKKSVKFSTYVLKKLNQSHAGNVLTLNVEYPCWMKSESLERWYVANDWSYESRTEPNQTKSKVDCLKQIWHGRRKNRPRLIVNEVSVMNNPLICVYCNAYIGLNLIPFNFFLFHSVRIVVSNPSLLLYFYHCWWCFKNIFETVHFFMLGLEINLTEQHIFPRMFICFALQHLCVDFFPIFIQSSNP